MTSDSEYYNACIPFPSVRPPVTDLRCDYELLPAYYFLKPGVKSEVNATGFSYASFRYAYRSVVTKTSISVSTATLSYDEGRTKASPWAVRFSGVDSNVISRHKE
jgi:hypothetical protein